MFIIRSRQELQNLRIRIANIFVAVILYNDDEKKLLVIQESDKHNSRFPGGSVDSIDDFKEIIVHLKERGVIRNIGEFFKVLARAAKRELKEEISLEIDESSLSFICGLVTEDQDDNGYHLKIFFKYSVPKTFSPKIDSSNKEEEKLIAFQFLRVSYDRVSRFMTLDPPLRLSSSHFRAALEAAVNGQI